MIKSNLSYNEFIYLNDENPFYIQQILYSKNLSENYNIGFNETNNKIEFVGIGFNGKNVTYINEKYDKITKDNCISYSMLNKINESPNIKIIETLDSGLNDFEVVFCHNGKINIINDSIFYDNFIHGSKIIGIENKKKSEINGTILRNTNNILNNYYISNNYTTRISTQYVKNLHNLHRIKYNFRFYFGLPKSFISINKKIKFFYINVAGEVLDLPTPVVGDFDLFFTLSKKSKTLVDLPKFNGLLKSYSIYELIFNLCKIIFYQTNFKPWNDEKYDKRIIRLFNLAIFDYLHDCAKNGNIKIYTESIRIILEKLILINETNSKNSIKMLFSYVKTLKDISFKNIMKCSIFVLYKNINDIENNKKLLEIIINIFTKFIDFNLVSGF